MLHLCAAGVWGLWDNVPVTGSLVLSGAACSTAHPTPKRPWAALQVVYERYQDIGAGLSPMRVLHK